MGQGAPIADIADQTELSELCAGINGVTESMGSDSIDPMKACLNFQVKSNESDPIDLTPLIANADATGLPGLVPGIGAGTPAYAWLPRMACRHHRGPSISRLFPPCGVAALPRTPLAYLSRCITWDGGGTRDCTAPLR